MVMIALLQKMCDCFSMVTIKLWCYRIGALLSNLTGKTLIELTDDPVGWLSDTKGGFQTIIELGGVTTTINRCLRVFRPLLSAF